MSTDAPELSSNRQRGERAAHAIYGSIVVLAVIVALDDTDVTAGETIGTVVGAAVITALAELYADYIGAVIRHQRHLTSAEREFELQSIAVGFLTALTPVVFFVLAALGLMDLASAFDAAVWTGVVVLGAYAVIANRFAGIGIGRSILIGAGFTALGALLVGLKVVL